MTTQGNHCYFFRTVWLRLFPVPLLPLNIYINQNRPVNILWKCHARPLQYTACCCCVHLDITNGSESRSQIKQLQRGWSKGFSYRQYHTEGLVLRYKYSPHTRVSVSSSTFRCVSTLIVFGPGSACILLDNRRRAECYYNVWQGTPRVLVYLFRIRGRACCCSSLRLSVYVLAPCS